MSLLLLEGVHEVVFVFCPGDCLERFVESNCQLNPFVFDRAPGLYPEADDNTDAGQHKPKFMIMVSLLYTSTMCHMCSAYEQFRCDFIQKGFIDFMYS